MPSNITVRPSRKRPKSRFLRELGIVGWDHLEPVILASLATESPLLLIGRHGCAKTLVLTRLAEALGIALRHYNASLLNFDDLIGFPVPEAGKLVYLQTPSTIWDAEAVFFDEVSRCRPDLQNKLFPIVHERRVQGLALDRLRHRWAAMNPPPAADGKSGDRDYAGAEPLDVALADRFAFIAEVPSLAELSPADQLTTFGSGTSPDLRGVGKRLAGMLQVIRAGLPEVRAAIESAVAEYVQFVAGKLGESGYPLSTRRAVQLARNIEALAAVLATEGRESGTEDAFFVALHHSIPDAAWGRPVPRPQLAALHRTAWEIVRAEFDELKSLLREADPLRRIARVLAMSDVPALDRGQVLADSYAALERPSRLLAAAVLMPRVARCGDLPAASFEAIAADYEQLAGGWPLAVHIDAPWKIELVDRWDPALRKKSARGMVLANVAALLVKEHELRVVLGAKDAVVKADDLAAVAEHTFSALSFAVPKPARPKARKRRTKGAR